MNVTSWELGGCTVGCAHQPGLVVHEHMCTWEIMKKKTKNKKNQHSVPQRAEFAAAHGMQAKLVLWVVLEEHGFSWFPQNKDALQCPQRNYLEKLMQTFDRKEGRKG